MDLYTDHQGRGSSHGKTMFEREPPIVVRPWRPPFYLAGQQNHLYTHRTLSRQPEQQKFGVDPFWLGRLNLLDAHKYSVSVSCILFTSFKFWTFDWCTAYYKNSPSFLSWLLSFILAFELSLRIINISCRTSPLQIQSKSFLSLLVKSVCRQMCTNHS